MWKRSLTVLLVTSVLGGCMQAGPEGPPAPEPRRVGTHVFECPNGATGESAPGVCIQRLAWPERSLQEPDLAIHPDDPDIRVLGFIHGRAANEYVVDTHIERARVDLLVTTDGGATWAFRNPPSARLTGLPTGTLATADPSLVFTADGRLHVTVMAGEDIIHTSSDDLGATWAHPTAFTYQEGAPRYPDGSGGGADRQWLTALQDGSLVVTWQRPSERSEFAISRDGGATWSIHIPPSLDGCVTVSPAVEQADRVLLSCTLFEGEDDVAIQVHVLDLTNGTTTPLARLPMPVVFSALHVLAEGRLVALGTDRSGTVLAVLSTDGGATWGPIMDLRTDLEADDGWTHAYRYASAVDEVGDVHLILGGRIDIDLPVGSSESWVGKVHVVLSGQDLRPLRETRIVPDEASPGDASQVRFSDHYGAIRPVPDGLLLVWGRDGGLDISRLTIRIHDDA